MAVIQIQGGGGGLLGTLGGIATIGGALTGQPWLTGLGTALGTADSMINGGGGGGVSASGGGGNSLTGFLSNLFGLKKDNPGSGSLAKSDPSMSSADEKAIKEKVMPQIQWPSMVSNTGNSPNGFLNPIGIYNYQSGWPNYF